jgi:hypothetical protein
MKGKRMSTHAEGEDDFEEYIASEGACRIIVSMISKRFSYVETFIQKVFLFIFIFRWERHPPGLRDIRLDRNFRGFEI